MLGKLDTADDYIFSYNGSNAWASWKRVIDGWDEKYSFLDNEDLMQSLIQKYGNGLKKHIELAEIRRKEGIPYWETILFFNSLVNSRYAIISSKNLVKNIGMSEESTHSKVKLEYLTKTEKRIFNLPVYHITFPLNHPDKIEINADYTKKLNRFYAIGHPLIKLYRKAYHAVMYAKSGVLLDKLRNRK